MDHTMLIFASWGDPYSWGKTRYSLRLEDGRQLEAESPTSISVLTEYAKEKGLSSHLVVVVQETLLAAPRMRQQRGNCIPLRRDYPPITQLHGADEEYHGLIDELRRGVATWAERAGLHVDHSDVVVAPGVGVFRYRECGDTRGLRASWRLEPGLEAKGANPFSFYASIVFLHAVATMLEHNSGGLHVAVDLTHGINYTSTALYRAVLAASRIYAAATGNEVILDIYNSEPYSPGESLHVWRIRREWIRPKAAASRIVYTVIAGRKFPPNLSAALISTDNSIFTHLRRLFPKRILSCPVSAAAATAVGAPLLLLQAGLEALEHEYNLGSLHNITKSLEQLVPRVNVEEDKKKDEKGLVITHRLALDFNSIKAYVACFALNLYAANAYTSLKSKGQVREERSGKEARAAATIDALEEVANNYLTTIGHYIVKQEVANLKKAASEYTDKEDLYRRVHRALQECIDQPVSATSNVDNRIFIAHAGLNSNIVDVLCMNGREEGRIYLAYSLASLGGVKRVSKDILSKLRETLQRQGSASS